MANKAKKILFIATSDLTTDQRMQRICSSLFNNGFEVLLVGRKLPQSSALSQQAYVQKRLNCWFNKGFLFYAEFNIRLFFLVFNSNYDTVCAVDLDTLLAAYYGGKLSNKHIIYDAHEYFSESPELVNRPKVKRFWTKLEERLLPKVKRVYTVSEGIKDIFQQKYSREVDLIRNMPILTSTPKENQKPYIIYQGALNVGRGLEVLIDCMPFLDVDLVLAGEGDLSFELRERATKSKAKDRIKFLGKVAPEKLKAITANAVVGINLLEPMGESYINSLSNKFFDYVMAEIPQICIDFPEYNRLNKEYTVAVLVPDLNLDNLVKEINRLLSDQTLCAVYIAYCKKAKLVWNWGNEEKKMISIYRDLE